MWDLDSTGLPKGYQSKSIAVPEYIPAQDRIEIFDDPALSADKGLIFSRPSAAMMMKLIRILVYKPVLKVAGNHGQNSSSDR
jgi:hypothetical protein